MVSPWTIKVRSGNIVNIYVWLIKKESGTLWNFLFYEFDLLAYGIIGVGREKKKICIGHVGSKIGQVRMTLGQWYYLEWMI